MSWAEMELLGLDTETTSPDPTEARLVTGTLAISPATDAEVTDPTTVEWMADPGIAIPEGAAEVHGITTEHAREHGRPEGEVVAEMLAWLTEYWSATRPLCVYNASFDLTLLDRRGRAHGLLGDDGIPILGPIVDALVMDRMHRSTRFRRTAHEGGRTLVNVCRFYGVPFDVADAHDATADCLAAVAVARAAGRRHRDLGRMSLRDLYVWQRRAARTWGVEMTAFLRRKATEDGQTAAEIAAIVREGDWPLRPCTAHPEREAI